MPPPGYSRPWPTACLSRAASVPVPGRVAPPPPLEMLVPRKMAISPLESWLTARYLLGSLAPTPECPPEPPAAPAMRCKSVLKIRRRKMNHHKYRKLVKRTRFLRRRVREGRLRRKQVSCPLECPAGRALPTLAAPLCPQERFEKDLRRIWLKAGLKEAPEGWQTPKIYLKSK